MIRPANKASVIQAIETLPEDALQELATFIEFLQFKAESKSPRATPYRPIRLGGLWKGAILDENELGELRRDMWKTLGDSEPRTEVTS